MRANMPFSNPSKNEYGTFYWLPRKFSTTRQMLENMFLEMSKVILIDYLTLVLPKQELYFSYRQ